MFDPIPTRGDFWSGTKWIAVIAAAGLVIYGGLHVAGVIGTAASAPGRVINRTLETNNIITNYEWFYDVDADYRARLGQIATHNSMFKNESNSAERSRLMIELSAMRQSCRDLAVKYNANSEKVNRAIFKSHNLPETLLQSRCEE